MQSFMIDASTPRLYELVQNAENSERQRPFKTFQSKDIQSIAKISKMQLLHWTQQGAIIPLQDAHGRGKVRLYNYQNLIEAMICRELTSLSVGIRVIKEWLDCLREDKKEYYFYFSLETIRISNKVVVALEKMNKWRAKAPGANGQEILTIIDERKESRFDDVNKILHKVSKAEKKQLMNWLKERDELVKNETVDFEHKKEDPPAIIREHSIWEFIRLYPVALVQFFLVIALDKDEGLSASIFDIQDVNKVFKAKTSIVINFDHLIKEGGSAHEE